MSVRIQPKDNRFWAGIPPLLVIGSVVVLFPIFAFMTVQNINRQKENSVRLLLEKGAALIRSFEAGTRTGMGARQWGDFKLQKLLSETAQQSDIIYLLVADKKGTILAHNDLTQIRGAHGKKLNLEAISGSIKVQWRQVSMSDGRKVFEVFRKFSPIGPPMGRHRGPMMFHHRFGTPPHGVTDISSSERIIFVGLDMGPVEAARRSDTRHILIMGSILLLIGFAGIILLFLAQSYRAAKASLSRVKAFSDNLVENIPIGLIAIDDSQKIASFNHVAGSVLGLSSGETAGRDAKRVLPGELWKQIDSLKTDRGVVEKEIECFLNNGKMIPLEISASPLHDENRFFLGYVLLFKDLSEVHALRKEIARNQRLASVGKLAAGVAHEIRNPLSSIKGFATYFKERYQEKKEDQHVATVMIQEVDRLNRVVGQLLEFARPITVSKKATSMKALIEDSLKLIERQTVEKNINVRTRFASDINDVSLDPDRMSQVLLNLYLNAIESMEPGGNLSVTLENDEDKKQLEISISDTGIGIHKEDMAHIFDPYYTTKAGGTGLGLAIVHNIIEAHNGEIKTESRIGEGTTVALLIPYK